MNLFTNNNSQGRFTLLLTMALLLLTANFAFATTVGGGEWQTVTGVTVDQGSRFTDGANGYYTNNKITNNSGAALTGPVRLLVTSSTHTVKNPDGNDAGKPYLNALAAGIALANGATGQPIRINFELKRGAFSYTLAVQRFVTVADSDGDGIPDSSDACPLDSRNDEDHDGVCGNVDTCPLDPQNDADHDGICGNVDACPLDQQNDADHDGICGNVDTCPLDPTNDEDGDAICGSVDFCPVDASNTCVSINGQVLGSGAALNGASIKIGTPSNNKTTVTDGIGKFTVLGLGPVQTAHDNLNDFYPIEVTAPGYSTGYAKVAFAAGKTSYDITINLQPVSDNFTVDEDLNQGVEINKAGAAVGFLTIPDGSLPAGVNDITGSVTYLDPATDLGSAPGGDLLALPQGVDPNATPVPLESFGMMEFDLKDQNGNPVHELGGSAEVCMKATPGLQAGDTIPLWYYDDATGLWKEEGQGSVVTKQVNGVGTLMICGSVSHFTWWNYDQPIATHSCFKFDIRDETTGNRLTGNMDWQAEGVTYSGTSFERACNVDPDDPTDVGSTIDSLTVKKSTTATTEQIRVFTYVGGNQYYLKRDGDGTYSLTQNQGLATVFNAPSANGSCLNNSNVDQCAFLDYQDANADGILPLSSDINYPPVISNFTVASSNLLVGASTAVSAEVTDPEDTDVSVAWTTECGWYNTADSGTISPTNNGPSPSPAVFDATFTAPSSLSYPVEYCRITATATDSNGNSTRADQWVYVTGNNQAVIEGFLYGTNGLPMANTPMQHSYQDCIANNTIFQSVTTDANGHYSVQFNANTCGGGGFSNNVEFRASIIGPGYYDLGKMQVNYSHDGTQITRYEDLNNGYFYYNNNCTVQPNAATQCIHDIRLPTVWGPLSGALYPIQGEAVSSLYFNSYPNNGPYSINTHDYTWLYPAPGAASYGPVSLPVGAQGSITAATPSGYQLSINGIIPSTEGLSLDIGDATAPVTVKLFDGLGGVIAGAPVYLQSYGVGSPSYNGTSDGQGEFTATTPLGGLYAYSTVSPIAYEAVSGYAFTKGQPVHIDINSPDTCTVTGVAYDRFGLPLAAGVTIDAYSDGNYYYNNSANGYLQAVTDANGRYVFTGVNPGSFRLNLGNSSYPIDNCRPVNGINRDIRIDRPDIQNWIGPQ